MRSSWRVSFVLALAACGSSEPAMTSGGADAGAVGDGSSGVFDCAYQKMPLAPNQTTVYGFTLEQFAMVVAGEHHAVLTWARGPVSGYDYAAPGGSTTLTVTVKEVTFRTADGGFDETWTVVASPNAGPQENPPRGWFNVDLVGATIKGSFRAIPGTLGPGEEPVLGLSSSFGGGSATGFLYAGRMKDGSGGVIIVANWKAP
jgi:hypothetical protein